MCLDGCAVRHFNRKAIVRTSACPHGGERCSPRLPGGGKNRENHFLSTIRSARSGLLHHHSVECARSPNSGSPRSFLPIFFAGGVKDALFPPPSGPNPPAPPRQAARPVKSTTYGAPVPRDASPEEAAAAASSCDVIAICRSLSTLYERGRHSVLSRRRPISHTNGNGRSQWRRPIHEVSASNQVAVSTTHQV